VTNAAREGGLQGFDPRYRDFPHYIIAVTREIWEDRGVATLRRHYAPDIVVRSPAGVVVGNEGVIAATLATLSEFPDRALLAEDVIWSGTPQEGMLSSHRIVSTATHLGSGVYGAATGKALRYRIVADCHARAGRIDDEWLIRDQGAIVRQLGIDPAEFARREIARQGGPQACPRPFTPEADRPGPYAGRGNDDEWGLRYEAILRRIMEADLSVIAQDYDRACALHYPGGVDALSHAGAERFWVGLRAAFPSAEFRVEHRIGRHDPLMPPRAAIRFSLTGRHDGWGAFGVPTGAPVHVMAAAHAEFGPWGLRRETVLYDETAIHKQIALFAG